MFLARYATAKDFYIPIIKVAVQNFAVGADWTPAAGDVKVITEGTAANITTLPTAVTSGNGALWKVPMTSGELTGRSIQVAIIDAATKAIEDQCLEIETYGHEDSMHPYMGIPVQVYGKFVTGTLTDATCTTNLTQANDQLQRRKLVVLSGTYAGEEVYISDNALTNGQLWFASRLTGNPANNDRFVIL